MATITISFDITDAKQVELLEGFNGMAEKNISIQFENTINNYKLDEKGEETNIQFGKRCIKTIVEETLTAYFKNKDIIRNNLEVSEIDPIIEPNLNILT
jgi:hypothetical protein